MEDEDEEMRRRAADKLLDSTGWPGSLPMQPRVSVLQRLVHFLPLLIPAAVVVVVILLIIRLAGR